MVRFQADIRFCFDQRYPTAWVIGRLIKAGLGKGSSSIVKWEYATILRPSDGPISRGSMCICMCFAVWRQ